MYAGYSVVSNENSIYSCSPLAVVMTMHSQYCRTLPRDGYNTYHVRLTLILQIRLVLHSYSNLYGTLLGNNIQQREKEELSIHTESLWRMLDDKKYINLLYDQLDKVMNDL